MASTDRSRITTQDEALRYLESVIDIPECVLLVGRLAATFVSLARRWSTDPSTRPSSSHRIRQLAAAFQRIIQDAPDDLSAGITAIRLMNESIRTLAKPYIYRRPLSVRLTQKLPHYYERYMILAGRAKEIIVDDELARALRTRLNDPRSLHKYRQFQRLPRSRNIWAPADADIQLTRIIQPSAERAERLDWRDRCRSHISTTNCSLDHPGRCWQDDVHTRLMRQVYRFVLDKRELHMLTRYVMGIFMLNLFLGYRPSDTHGFLGFRGFLGTLLTFLTLSKCFFPILESFGVKDDEYKVVEAGLSIVFCRSLLATLSLCAGMLGLVHLSAMEVLGNFLLITVGLSASTVLLERGFLTEAYRARFLEQLSDPKPILDFHHGMGPEFEKRKRMNA